MASISMCQSYWQCEGSGPQPKPPTPEPPSSPKPKPTPPSPGYQPTCDVYSAYSKPKPTPPEPIGWQLNERIQSILHNLALEISDKTVLGSGPQPKPEPKPKPKPNPKPDPDPKPKPPSKPVYPDGTYNRQLDITGQDYRLLSLGPTPPDPVGHAVLVPLTNHSLAVLKPKPTPPDGAGGKSSGASPGEHCKRQSWIAFKELVAIENGYEEGVKLNGIGNLHACTHITIACA